MENFSVNLEELVSDYNSNTSSKDATINDMLKQNGFNCENPYDMSESITRKYDIKKGDYIYNEDSRESFHVTDENDMFVTAKNIKTGEVSKFLKTYKTIQPCPVIPNTVHTWSIKDAKAFDVIATDNFVFMFKQIGEYSGAVYCYCAVLLSRINMDDENAFIIPAKNAVIGTSKNTSYRPATEEEKKYLLDELDKHGLEMNYDKNYLALSWNDKNHKNRAIIHRWFVDTKTNELFRVASFYKDEFTIEHTDGSTFKKDAELVRTLIKNNEYKRWEFSNATINVGDVFVQEHGNDEWLYMATELVGSKMTFVEFYANEGKFAKKEWRLSPENYNKLGYSIEPATDFQKEQMISLMKDSGYKVPEQI